MKYNITKHRKIWITLSSILVALSIFLTFILGTNLGLDFLGGIRWTTEIQLQNSEEFATISEITEFFDNQKSEQKLLTKSAKIQETTNNEFLITIENLSDEDFTILKDELSEKYKVTEKSFRRVDPSVGGSFKTKSFYALGFALIGIIIFVAIAFAKIPKAISPWRFGGVAILALFHDILIILGVFVVLGYFSDIELDLQFLTALLATLGFSVNDTIVILDRVRENLRTQKSTETFDDTIEKSIQQTLHRSINTSISTILPLFFLLIFGASSIFYFVLALSIGILIGTYSSIFLAAPLLVSWKKWSEK